MQELLGVLEDRCSQLRRLTQRGQSQSVLNRALLIFQFNQHLRENQQKKAVVFLVQNIQSLDFLFDFESRIEAVKNQFRSLCNQQSIPFGFKTIELQNVQVLKQFLEVSRQVAREIKQKIVKKSFRELQSICKVSLNSIKYKDVIQSYSSRVGLSTLVDLQNCQKNQRSACDLVSQSTKANIRIMNNIKQYSQDYNNYINRLEKKRFKRIVFDSVPVKEERGSLTKNISPFKKIIGFSENSKNREVNKKQKVPLPPALKRIQFPHLFSPKAEQSMLFTLLPKKVSKKVVTMPSELLFQNRSRNEVCPRNKRSINKTPFAAKLNVNATEVQLERINLSVLKSRLRNVQPQGSNASLQTTFCFDDEAFKVNWDNRLWISNKGLI